MGYFSELYCLWPFLSYKMWQFIWTKLCGTKEALKFILVNIVPKMLKLRTMSVLVEGHFADQHFTS